MSTELLEETLDKLFAKHCGPSERQRAEMDGWLRGCWDALHEAELVWLGIDEAAGGSGGTVREAAVLVRTAGAHAVPLPLAECTLLGGWLVQAAGLTLPRGPVTVAVPRQGDELILSTGTRVSGRLQRVPWGGACSVVGVGQSPQGPVVVVIDPRACSIIPGRNIAGEPRDALQLDNVPVAPEQLAPVSTSILEELELRGALSRALLLAGAADAAAQLTVKYASERRQFGRPIAGFQAVAHRMVRMVSEAEAATLAATVAAHRYAELSDCALAEHADAAFEIGLARASVGRSANEVAAQAHQVHGAMGMTQEYALHHFTRRIWSWSLEWGTERQWSTRVGKAVAEIGAGALWPMVVVSPVER